MKRTTIYYFIVAVASILFAMGCRKDNSIDGMYIVCEGMHSNSKGMVDGLTMNWVAGDSLRINGENKAIIVNSDGQAYIEDVAASDVYRAIYPSSLNSTATLDNDNLTVTIPDTYLWTADGDGKQILDVPMAARSTDGNRLYFKHLTAAITVEITNYYGFAVLVDSVVVMSSNAGTQYQISGATSIILNNAEMGINTNNNPTSAEKKVKVIFGDGAHALKINQGDTKKVQVPVLPVGAGNKFSISVTVHKDGNQAVNRTFTKTQVTGGAMGRAKMAYAGHTVGYLFSIGNNKKVIISQGNLQYQASSKEWRFATNQYDYIGANAGNTTANDRASQAYWIDLFGWGTSGWNNGNTYYMPYDIGSNGTPNQGYGYGPTKENAYTFSLTGIYAEADWGVHNKISNGGNAVGMWRTLSNSETGILFKNRSTITQNMPSGTNKEEARFIKALVGNTLGVILFPDNYIHPNDVVLSYHNRCYNSIDKNYSFSDFAIGANDWPKMEAAGAIFLPAAGFREGGSNINVSHAGSVALYWSATSYPPTLAHGKSYSIKFCDGESSSVTENSLRHLGCSVRLVMDVE